MLCHPNYNLLVVIIYYIIVYPSIPLKHTETLAQIMQGYTEY